VFHRRSRSSEIPQRRHDIPRFGDVDLEAAAERRWRLHHAVHRRETGAGNDELDSLLHHTVSMWRRLALVVIGILSLCAFFSVAIIVRIEELALFEINPNDFVDELNPLLDAVSVRPRISADCSSDSFVFHDLSAVLERLATYACPVIICGDLNVHVEQANDPNAARLHQLLELLGYSQHVNEQTHTSGHTLDLVMTRSETDVSDVHTGPYISDHALIRFSLCVKKLVADQQWTTSRTWRRLSRDDFATDLAASRLCSNLDAHSNASVDEMAKLYSGVLTELLDRHCPAVKVRGKPRRRHRGTMRTAVLPDDKQGLRKGDFGEVTVRTTGLHGWGYSDRCALYMKTRTPGFGGKRLQQTRATPASYGGRSRVY